MGSFFASQTDYITFLVGLCAMVLGGLSFVLLKTKRNAPIWKMMTLFGISQTVSSWLVWVKLIGHEDVFLQTIRLAFLISSFAALFEIGRAAFRAKYGKIFGRWLWLPYLFIFYFGWKTDGLNGLNIFARYFLALPGALWAAKALCIQSRAECEDKIRCIWFRAYSVFIALFGISQVIVPAARFFPASVLNETNFLQFAKISILAVRGILAFAAAIVSWFYLAASGIFPEPVRRKTAWRVAFGFSTLLIAGWLLTQALGNYNKDQITSDFLEEAGVVSAVIAHEDIAVLTGSPDDAKLGHFIKIKEQLATMLKVMNEKRFIYLVRFDQGKIVFLLDAEPEDSPDYAAPGEVYKGFPPELLRCFENGIPVVTRPYADKWGKWVSSFIPIKNSNTAKTDTVLGIDTGVEVWMESVFSHRFFGIFITMCAFILFVSFLVVYLLEMVSGDMVDQSREFLDKIISYVADPIFVKDRQHKFVLANEALCVLLGHPRDELIGKGDHDFFPKEQVDIFYKKDEEVFNTGAENVNEEFITGAYGITRTIVTKKTLYTDKAGNKFIVGVIRDVTDQRKAEKEIREALEMKSQFISMASHELRTPLTAIKESIGIMDETMAGRLDGEGKEFFNIAKRNIDRLARLINDILDFQKLEAGKAVFSMKENNINQVIKDVKAAMEPLAHEKGLRLTLELDGEVINAVFDRDKITQVLMNLIGNAIKYSAKGSVIVSSLREPDAVVVSVADNGPGIKEEDFPRLFRKFEQLAESDQWRSGGTGLGLAISKEIVEQHGGKIWVESRVGVGTKFSFRLMTEGRRK